MTDQVDTLREQVVNIVEDIEGCPGGEHLESHIDELVAVCQGVAKEARLDTASSALKACPTKDDKLRQWLVEHIAELTGNTASGEKS